VKGVYAVKSQWMFAMSIFFLNILEGTGQRLFKHRWFAIPNVQVSEIPGR